MSDYYTISDIADVERTAREAGKKDLNKLCRCIDDLIEAFDSMSVCENCKAACGNEEECDCEWIVARKRAERTAKKIEREWKV